MAVLQYSREEQIEWIGREKGRKEGREEGRKEGRKEGKEEGREEGIEALILDNWEDGKTETQILEKLERRFSLTSKKAKYYLSKYIKKEKV